MVIGKRHKTLFSVDFNQHRRAADFLFVVRYSGDAFKGEIAGVITIFTSATGVESCRK